MEFRFTLYNESPEDRPTEQDLAQIEQEYGFSFPKVLRAYYLDHDGDAIVGSRFTLDETEYAVEHITPVKKGMNSLTELLRRNRQYQDEPMYLVRLADDRGNGVYLWDTRNENVYFRYVDDMDGYVFICHGVDHFFSLLDQTYWRDKGPAYDITSMTRSDREMEKVEFLPLGSIVLLKGGIRKLLVIARGLNVKKDGETYFFDYGGVLYPDGLTGDEMVYFNADSINKVYFQGYQDDDNDIVLENLNTYLLEHPDLKRADPEKWNA